MMCLECHEWTDNHAVCDPCFDRIIKGKTKPQPADRQSAATTRLLEILREVREAVADSYAIEDERPDLRDLLDEAVEIVEGGA